MAKRTKRSWDDNYFGNMVGSALLAAVAVFAILVLTGAAKIGGSCANRPDAPHCQQEATDE